MHKPKGLPEIVGVAAHVLLVVAVFSVGRSIGIRFTADGGWQLMLLVVLLSLLWHSLARSLASTDRRFAVSTAGLLLLISAAAAALPAQYVIERLNRLRPWNDAVLIRADLAMGIDVREVLRWTVSHPNLRLALEAAYRSFIAQTFIPILCAYCGLLSPIGMRKYVWQFIVSLWVTLLVFGAVPVASPQVWWSYDPPMHVRSAMAGQLELIRGEGPVVFRFAELEGLVALPSFHTIGALAVTAACWRIRILGPALVIINTLLIAATVLLGIHYAFDIIAGALLYVAIVVALRFLR
jgi:hypothetical protein